MTANTSFDEDKMKGAAEEKGFTSIAEHLRHLTIESPQCCRIMYHHYKKIFNCQGETSEECEKLRDYLVSDCGADRKGNDIGFDTYNRSHTLEKYLVDEEVMEKVATEKGFDSIAHHLIYLTDKSTEKCRIIYHSYLKTFNCEGELRRNCEVLRNYLVAWCGATRNHKTLHSYPEKYEITAKYLKKVNYLDRIQEKLHGSTSISRYNNYIDLERLKGIARNGILGCGGPFITRPTVLSNIKFCLRNMKY